MVAGGVGGFVKTLWALQERRWSYTFDAVASAVVSVTMTLVFCILSIRSSHRLRRGDMVFAFASFWCNHSHLSNKSLFLFIFIHIFCKILNTCTLPITLLVWLIAIPNLDYFRNNGGRWGDKAQILCNIMWSSPLQIVQQIALGETSITHTPWSTLLFFLSKPIFTPNTYFAFSGQGYFLIVQTSLPKRNKVHRTISTRLHQS